MRLLLEKYSKAKTNFSTFLKRKSGLFKKAHELSVLCQIDISVIIFGRNKKLFEFTSADTNDIIDRYRAVCVSFLFDSKAFCFTYPDSFYGRVVQLVTHVLMGLTLVTAMVLHGLVYVLMLGYCFGPWSYF
jgi:hypothetical protein